MSKKQLKEMALPNVINLGYEERDELIRSLSKKSVKVLRDKQTTLIKRVKSFLDKGKDEAAAEDQAKQEVIAAAIGIAQFGESNQGSLFGEFLEENLTSTQAVKVSVLDIAANDFNRVTKMISNKFIHTIIYPKRRMIDVYITNETKEQAQKYVKEFLHKFVKYDDPMMDSEMIKEADIASFMSKQPQGKKLRKKMDDKEDRDVLNNKSDDDEQLTEVVIPAGLMGMNPRQKKALAASLSRKPLSTLKKKLGEIINQIAAFLKKGAKDAAIELQHQKELLSQAIQMAGGQTATASEIEWKNPFEACVDKEDEVVEEAEAQYELTNMDSGKIVEIGRAEAIEMFGEPEFNEILDGYLPNWVAVEIASEGEYELGSDRLGSQGTAASGSTPNSFDIEEPVEDEIIEDSLKEATVKSGKTLHEIIVTGTDKEIKAAYRMLNKSYDATMNNNAVTVKVSAATKAEAKKKIEAKIKPVMKKLKESTMEVQFVSDIQTDDCDLSFADVIPTANVPEKMSPASISIPADMKDYIYLGLNGSLISENFEGTIDVIQALNKDSVKAIKEACKLLKTNEIDKMKEAHGKLDSQDPKVRDSYPIMAWNALCTWYANIRESNTDS